MVSIHIWRPWSDCKVFLGLQIDDFPPPSNTFDCGWWNSGLERHTWLIWTESNHVEQKMSLTFRVLPRWEDAHRHVLWHRQYKSPTKPNQLNMALRDKMVSGTLSWQEAVMRSYSLVPNPFSWGFGMVGDGWLRMTSSDGNFGPGLSEVWSLLLGTDMRDGVFCMAKGERRM